MKNMFDLAVHVPLAVLDDEVDILLTNAVDNTGGGHHATTMTRAGVKNFGKFNVVVDNGHHDEDDFREMRYLMADLDQANNNNTNQPARRQQIARPLIVSNDSRIDIDNSVNSSNDHNVNSSNDNRVNASSNDDSGYGCDNSTAESVISFDDESDETGFSGFSGSLEDLVSHFDEKIASCLKNFQENTETIAPVQIRTQEEIMSESQIWLTLTGNFGNILPIDWSKTYARKLQLPSLNLRPKKDTEDEDEYRLDLSEDEGLSEAMDLHRMVASHDDWEPPPQSADEVIEEIDEIIMQQSMNSSGFNDGSDCGVMDSSMDSVCSALRSPSLHLNQYGYRDCCDVEDRVRETRETISSVENLTNYSYKQLISLKLELESLINIYNESLVQELAARDEQEYEKELKNTFISQLLSIQSKRRQFQVVKKRSGGHGNSSFYKNLSLQNANLPQYLTAVIPYHQNCRHLDNRTLQSLIRILRAINENNSDVPSLLTDYILNVLCPSTGNTPTC